MKDAEDARATLTAALVATLAVAACTQVDVRDPQTQSMDLRSESAR